MCIDHKEPQQGKALILWRACESSVVLQMAAEAWCAIWRRTRHLLDNVLLYACLEGIGVIREGGPGLCLHLQRAHLGSILPDNGVVALQVVMLCLTDPQQTLSDTKACCAGNRTQYGCQLRVMNI